MLSRVAERVYWLGRYVERMESAARLINVNSNLLLDLPKDVHLGWRSLIDIMGCHKEFEEKKLKEEELSVVRFLIADLDNPASIFTALKLARENARTTREIIPTEAWELINDLYFHVKENVGRSTSRAQRQNFLRNIVQQCQQFVGMLAGTMSHTNAYDFIRLGRNLERADMTTRIVDVGTVNLITNSKVKQTQGDELEPFINILWMSVLQSMSAYQMYRQHVLDRVNGEDVVMFMLQDEDFPRSVLSCLSELVTCLNKLPEGGEALKAVATAQRHVKIVKVEEVLADDSLHEFIDTIQLDIASINNEIAKKWFLPAEIYEES
ncbi:MAG: alpha-E domain-containing protein [Cellvibrionaceae bacterium]